MAETGVTINRGDEFRVGTVGALYGRVAVGEELFIVAKDPATLEQLGEALIEAGRDLRFAILAENERRADAALVTADDTSQAMAHFRAKREACEQREAS